MVLIVQYLCQFLVLAGNRFWFYILMYYYLEYNIRLVNLKGTIRHLGGSEKRTKLWFEILLGQILIMDINQFVFVLFLLLLFLF